MKVSWLKTTKNKLVELVNDNYTDKNTAHSYLPLYQSLFESKRENAKNVLEIGIKEGGSIRLWNDFFINATVYGIDIYDRIKADIRNRKNIKLIWEDAYNAEFFKNTFSGMKFDMILDDGPHDLHSMKQCITLYSQVMADNGILVIEDVQDWSWISELTNTVPDNLKQYIKSYDLRGNKGRYDDIVFTIDKSKTN